MAFRTCENKGFHITFKNGWTVSIQIGAGNYCDNYDLMLEKSMLELIKKKPDMESNTAEVWAWKGKKHYPDDPLAYQTPEQVLEFMNKIKRKRK